jgi:hypothetical protein
MGLVFRSLFLLVDGSDLYSHIWLVKKRREFGNLWEDHVDDSVIEGYRGYPPLGHYLVSLFPEEHWIAAGRFLNITYDLVSIIIIYYLTDYLFSDVWHIRRTGTSGGAMAVSLLYATSPILHPVTARLKAIGGRTLGNLLCLIYIVLFAYGFLYGKYWAYPLCIPLAWAIVLTSQFSMQYLVFSSLFLSLLYLDIIPFALVFFSIIMGIFIPKLGIRKLLQRKIDHYIWYVRNYNKGTTASNRNNIRDIVLLPYYLLKNPRYFFKLCLFKITPIIAAYSLPPLLLFVIWFIMNPDQINLLANNKVSLFLSYLVLSTFFIFSLTSLKPLLFLGQAERYFEYSSGFLYILLYFYVYIGNIKTEFFLPLFSFQIAVIIFHYFYSQRSTIKEHFLRREKHAFKDLIDYLKEVRGLRLLSIPTKMNFKIATLVNDRDAKFYYDNISRHNKIDGIKYMEEDHVTLHYVKADMDYFVGRYGINTVVAEKRSLGNALEHGIKYNFDNEDKIYENDEYLVYRLKE